MSFEIKGSKNNPEVSQNSFLHTKLSGLEKSSPVNEAISQGQNRRGELNYRSPFEPVPASGVGEDKGRVPPVVRGLVPDAIEFQYYRERQERLPERVQENQTVLRRQLEKKRPIYLEKRRANGDDMIHVWAHYQVLLRACEEFQLPYTNIQLLTQDPYVTGFIYRKVVGKALHMNNFESDKTLLPTHWRSHYQQKEYLKAATAFGIPIHLEDFQYAPQPLRMPYGPFRNFDRERVIEKGEQKRQEAKRQGKNRKAIFQFGRWNAKRLLDDQVRQIAQAIKEIDPGAYVTAVTDKYFLNMLLENKGLRPDEFPIDDDSFKQQIANSTPSAYGGSVDDVVTGDINEILSELYASDDAGTDGFGAWLAGGSIALRPESNGRVQPNDLVVLHPIADPFQFAVPGATIIESPLITAQRNSLDNHWGINGLDLHNGFVGEDVYYGERMNQEPKLVSIYPSSYYGYAIPISSQNVSALIAKLWEVYKR